MNYNSIIGILYIAQHRAKKYYTYSESIDKFYLIFFIKVKYHNDKVYKFIRTVNIIIYLI